MANDQPADRITLSLPAETGSLQLVRLNVAAAAGGLGFDVDEIDDLKIAVEELAAWLVTVDADARLLVDIDPGPGMLAVAGHRAGGPDAADLDEYLPLILDATVDHYEARADGSTVGFRLEKRTGGG